MRGDDRAGTAHAAIEDDRPADKAGPTARIVWAVTALACLAPFVLLAVNIHRYGVNMPHSDQWELVGMIEKSRTVGVGLGDLYAQHNEQRILVPRLLMLLLAGATSWNIRAELLVNLILGAGIFCFLAALLKRTFSSIGLWSAVPVACISLLVFSPVQWENWSWGWQISWFLPLFCFLAVLCLLTLWPDSRPPWPALAAATVIAVVGQYSLFSATLIWVAGLPLLLMRRDFRKYWWVWCLAAAASTGTYLWEYTSPPLMAGFKMSPAELIEDPRPGIEYVLYYLGRPVLDEKPVFFIGGIFVLSFAVAAMYLLLFRREQLRAAAPWMAIGSYAFISSVLTMANRVRLGLEQAGSSRYTTIGILLMISTVVLVSLAILPGPGKPVRGFRLAPVMGAWLVVLGLFVADYSSEVKAMQEFHEERVAMLECIRNAEIAGDPCLPEVYADPELLMSRVRYLREIGWTAVGS